MANGRMTPARTSVGSVPPEATKQGSLNGTPDPNGGPTPATLDAGPKVSDKGSYLPAAYKTARGSIRVDR